MDPAGKPHIRSAFVEQPNSTVVGLTQFMFGVAFLYSALVALPRLGYTGILGTQIGFLAGSLMYFGLGIWLLTRKESGPGLLDGVTLLALVTGLSGLLWTEFRWPDDGVGPYGYMLLLNCYAGFSLRRRTLVLPFLALGTSAWLVLDFATTGPYDFGANKSGVVVISALTGLLTHLVVSSTRRKEEQLTAELIDQANTDPVTGILNRTGLINTLATRAPDEPELTWAACADIDYFKQINDEFGHAYGDTALAAVGRVLTDVGAGAGAELTTRLGGDEFAILGHGVAPDEGALNRRVNELLQGGGAPCHITIGVAIRQGADPHPGPPAETASQAAEALISRADARMYERRQTERTGRPQPAGPWRRALRFLE